MMVTRPLSPTRGVFRLSLPRPTCLSERSERMIESKAAEEISNDIITIIPERLKITSARKIRMKKLESPNEFRMT